LGEHPEYDFVVVPTIDSINSNSGSNEGQIITIEGNGFTRFGTNEVMLGDTECKILEVTETSIECEIQERVDNTFDF